MERSDPTHAQTVEESRSRRARDTADLRRGIGRGELFLHYQPKVDSFSGQLRGVEALVRWHHPARGVVSPSQFVPLAEESGLIEPLGEWVLAEACRQQVEWALALGSATPPFVCVNVSGYQLTERFPDRVRQILAESEVVPESICLEITESAVMADLETAIRVVRELKSLGLVIAIDDFGTGHSSLSHLRRFSVDELKIDKSFVDRLNGEAEDTALVAAIIAMAHALGILVTAEGVETPPQLWTLRDLGCEMIQGYLFSRPLPPEEIAQLGTFLEPTGGTDVRSSSASGTGAVLVVDDAEDVRRLARLSLAASGFEVVAAASGEEALEMARKVAPRGIVLDISMPGMDGFEACRALRADPRTCRAAIVMLTSLADAQDKIAAFSAGADDYMVKPFAPRDLVSRLRQAMERQTRSEEGPAGESPLDLVALAPLQDLGAADPAGVEDLVRLFLRDARSRLSDMRTAAVRGDSAEVARIAHGLRGSSASLAARSMADLCAELEAEPRDSGAVLSTLQRLDSEMDRVESALRATFELD